jgi:hypothetical protein
MRMAAIPRIFTSHGENEWSHGCIATAELVAIARRNVVASLVIDVVISLVSKTLVVKVAGKNGRHSMNIHTS